MPILTIIIFVLANIGLSASTNRLPTTESKINSILLDIKRASSTFKKTSRPFVVVSYAQSLNGLLAPPTAKVQTPISSPNALKLSHGIRSVVDAVLIGGGTLKADNPRLTNRLYVDKENCLPQPRSVVVVLGESSLKLAFDEDLNIRQNNRQVIFALTQALYDTLGGDHDLKSDTLGKCECAFLIVDHESNHKRYKVYLPSLLNLLRSKHGIESVMVEGGSTLLSKLFTVLADFSVITISSSFMFGPKSSR